MFFFSHISHLQTDYSPFYLIGKKEAEYIFSITLRVFERELALLVTLQGVSSWNGGGGDFH